MERHSMKWGGSSLLLLLLFLILSALALFPLFALLLASFKPSQELLRFGLNLKLQADLLSFHNYASIFKPNAYGVKSAYILWYRNSIAITAIYTFISLLFSSMVGYGLAVYRFRFRNAIFVMVLIVMMIPVEILLLPLYELMIATRLIDTIWGVILPFAVAPLPIFFFRQYAAGLPKDFLDASRIDGCTEFGIFFRIMVPLMAPAYGAMAILQALQCWNNFLWPIVVLRTNEKLTLPIGLASLITPYGNNYDILIAGSLLTVIPLIVLFLFFQRFFISGLTVGGVKG